VIAENQVTIKPYHLMILSCAVFLITAFIFPGSIPFTVPNIIPTAEGAHNANLFVSAENSNFGNSFGGPMVVEIVINDPAITDINEAKGEPDVTINGHKVRMVQASDGLWYAYVADRAQAQLADSLVGATAGLGTDFGTFCDNNSAGLAGSGSVADPNFSDTVGIAVDGVVTGGVQGTATIEGSTTCSAVIAGTLVHVVREPKSPNTNGLIGPGNFGQIDIDVDAWPFIQLYDFNPTGSVEIKYNKGGGTQTTTLTFDTLDTFSDLSLDRSSYTTGSEVHAVITDGQLNIDPTDEDSWTFATAAPFQTRYQLFNENGGTDGDIAGGSADISASLGTLMFEDNGIVELNPNTRRGPSIVDLDATNKQGTSFVDGTVATSSTTLMAAGTQPMTFVETANNSGSFTNYDENDDSNLDILPSAARGTSASIEYSKEVKTIVVGFGFGTISIDAPSGGEWNSGEEIAVTLVDSDANKNSHVDEDLDVSNPAVTLVPALKIGNPETLNNPAGVFASAPKFVTTAVPGEPVDAAFGSPQAFEIPAPATTATSTASSIDRFSDIARITWPAVAIPVDVVDNEAGTALLLDLGETIQTVRASLVSDTDAVDTSKGFNLLNYDLRSITNQLYTGTSISYDVFLVVDYTTPTGTFATGPYLAIRLATDLTNAQRLVDITSQFGGGPLINAADTIDRALSTGTAAGPMAGAVDKDDDAGLLIVFDTVGEGTGLAAGTTTPITIDLFAFGITNDGDLETEKINNAIYRFELEESGDNTSTFIGTAEFTMLNQANIFTASTYTNLRTIDYGVTFIVHDNLDDEDAPTINYLDLGADGVSTQIADQEVAATHSGVVSFDRDTYNLGDIVKVTVQDKDLNLDSDLIDIYVTVSASNDPASDTVGKAGLGVYSNGDPIGRILEIAFDNMRWVNGQNNPISICPSAPTGANGLSATGFTLVETSPNSGIFKGDFSLPEDFCNTNLTSPDNTPIKGLEIKVNYIDFRDGSGKRKEVNDTAMIETNPDKYEIKFKNGSFHPTPGVLNVTAIKGNHSQIDTVHFLLQFKDLPNSDLKENFESNGIHILDYVTGNTYIVATKVQNLNDLNSTGLVNSAEPLEKKFKIAKALNKIQTIPIFANLTNKVILTVFFHSDVNLQDATDLIEGVNLGGTLLATVPVIPSISAAFDFDKINAIAQQDLVQYVDVVMPPLDSANDVARRAANVTPLHDPLLSYNLSGRGVKILIYDKGLVAEHPAFGPRIKMSDPDLLQAIPDRHATQVAGIVGGGSFISADNRNLAGMAPDIDILTFAVDENSEFFWTIPSDLYEDVLDAISNGADLATMSMAHPVHLLETPEACQYLGKYSEAAALIDIIVTGNATTRQPLIFFEAAGNERNNGGQCADQKYGTIASPATAKNSIAVGAINSDEIGSMSPKSSWGPTDDGRIKPDITAPGCRDNITGPMTTIPIDRYGESGCATSFATPIASGATALLIEQWKKTPGLDPIPMPHTVKAILIHTATNRGPFDGPDFQYGWGSLNAKAAVDLVMKKNSIMVNQVDTNEIDTILFTPDGSDKVKVTLVWDDPKATQLPTPTLINDLDLILKDPTGHFTYRPFLLYLGPNNAEISTHGVDTTNNVEMATADAIGGASGTWKAIITGPRVSDGHQEYTVIVSGTIQELVETSGSTLIPEIGVSSPTVKDGGLTNKKSIVFNYKSNISGDFKCKLDQEASFSNCQTTYSNLLEGDHDLVVKIDVAGQQPPQKIFSWTVDATAPETNLTSHLIGNTTPTASFTFSSSEPGSTFDCRLDTNPWLPKCTIPTVYTGLPLASHTFKVRAVDAAGNKDPSEETYTWTAVPEFSSLTLLVTVAAFSTVIVFRKFKF
jgi:hypothetical protein